MVTKILVVDDESQIRFIVRKMLEDAKYEVIEAKTGEECLEILEREKVDLVLMDIMMPGINGWEATKKIKEDPATKELPIAMLTVLTEEGDKVKSFEEAFADAHITKPIIMEKMLGTIEWLLNNAPKRDQQR
ncbi:MAG: response regulator [Candidatus Hydrothermarchaeales archaeon]